MKKIWKYEVTGRVKSVITKSRRQMEICEAVRKYSKDADKSALNAELIDI